MPRPITHNPGDEQLIADVVWQAVWGEGNNPTTALARVLAAERAARALIAQGLILDAKSLRLLDGRTARRLARP